MDTVISGETIGGPFYAKTPEHCQNICVKHVECEYWNFEFTYFGRGNSWSLAGYGKCVIGKNFTGVEEEEYFLSGLKGSCKEDLWDNQEHSSFLMLLVVLSFTQTAALVCIASILTFYVCR